MYKFLKSIFQCLHLLSVSIFNTFDKFFQLFFFQHRFISFQNRCLNFLFIIFHILPQYILFFLQYFNFILINLTHFNSLLKIRFQFLIFPFLFFYLLFYILDIFF